MKTKIISIVFLLLLIASTGIAQGTAEQKFGVYSINFTAGFNKPSMEYWNSTFLPSQGVTDAFAGNLVLGGNITFALPYSLKARIGVSNWKDKVEGTSDSKLNSLEIGLTRFRLGALYAPQSISFSGFQPYVGLEGQFYMIKNNLDNGIITSQQQGQDYSLAPVIGIDRSFGQLIVGLEFMYNIGSYTQEINSSAGILEQKVSISGSELALSIGYKF